MGEFFEFLGKLLGVIGGLGLIVLVLIWFGAIPITAAIFDAAFNGWQLIVLLGMMLAVICLIIKYVMK